MIHIHELGGCAPAPLAHYLKALGVLRLVAEQADDNVRGWWEGNCFQLGSCLTFDQLSAFLLQRYSPTPMLAPWNGASGFFKTWDKRKKALRNSKNFDALNAIRESTESRWDRFRIALVQADKILDSIAIEKDVSNLSDKERNKLLIVPSDSICQFPVAHKNYNKMEIQRLMQRTLHSILFFRSIIVDIGKDKPAYPSIWGSGGNDGAIDFTARYMENLRIVLDPKNTQSKNWLLSCLSASPAKDLLKGQLGKVGQFIPGGAGGANSVNGVGSQDDTLLNPWDFVLMLEGAVSFTSHMSRQCDLNPSHASSPFVVSASGSAYASASSTDETPRGEQWMPLWSRPLSYAELGCLLAEGRAQIGAKGAREPLDIARAVKRMGTARGISAFQRYGYIERNGQSNLAVPLGRFESSEGNSELLACIDDLDAWLRRLRRESRARHAPSRLASAEKHLADALLAVTKHPATPIVWQHVLICLTEVERIMGKGSGFSAQPVPRLRPEWIKASDDGTPEFRLALAFALQAQSFRSKQRTPIDPIRRHWLPLDQNQRRFATTSTGSTMRLDVRPEVVMHGRRGLDDAIALVERRLVETTQREGRHLPLKAAPRTAAGMANLANLISGLVDLDRTLTLARALMALDRKQWAEHPVFLDAPSSSDWPDDAWLAIRLCLLPWPLETPSGFKLDVGADPAIVRRLAAGDTASASRIALRRLSAAGVRCTIRMAAVSSETAQRWAAALAFPIGMGTAKQFLYRLDPSKKRSEHDH